jgi:hypothetical protein
MIRLPPLLTETPKLAQVTEIEAKMARRIGDAGAGPRNRPSPLDGPQQSPYVTALRLAG